MTATTSAGTMLRVTATVLNLRTGPGSSHPVIAQLPHGAVVERTVPGNGWTGVRTPEGRTGWVSSANVTAVVDDPDAPGTGDPDWYRIAWAERGVKEITGPTANPRIADYQASTTYPCADDEVPWCSSFVNWCMQRSGIPRTRSAAARSWLRWGRLITEPVRGCVVIFSRPGHPGSGHVALYVGREGDAIRVLGGNQGNQVQVSRYSADRVLGYRMPS